MSTTNYPTTIDAPVNPIATDTLASVDHAGQHTLENTAVVALETKVGVDGSAVTTTHDYKLSGVATGDKAVSKTGTEVLSNKTLTAPKINTGSDATGDIHYRDASGNFARLPIGTAGQILDVSVGLLPEWIPNPSAANASTTVKGVVEIATSAEITAGTGTGSTGAVLATSPDGLAAANIKPSKFGGTGTDGALNVTSGTTTIDLGSANFVEKNYTSINISGGATLAFSNPATTGTVIHLKSQGGVTIAGTISANAVGAAGGTAGTAAGDGGAGQNISPTLLFVSGGGTGGSGGTTGSGVAGTAVTSQYFYVSTSRSLSSHFGPVLIPGSGGGGGRGSTSAAGGAGGRGGGALYIECAGAWNFTGTINVSGADGSAGVGGAGGGGGGCGMFLGLYGSLTASSGTVTNNSGAGGTGGNGSGGGNTNGGGGGVAALGTAGSGATNSVGGAGSSGGGGAGGSSTAQAGGASSTNSALSFIGANNYF